jgi:hypothetical protein
MQATTKQQTPLFAVLAGVSVIVLGGTAFAQSNPLIGTWALNVAKSTLAGAPPTSLTRVVEPWESDGIKGTGTLVRPDGTRANEVFTAHYDGMNYRITGEPAFDTIALKRVDGSTTGITVKKDGKVVATGTLVVSSNGKMLTETQTVTNAEGQKVNRVRVFNRQ